MRARDLFYALWVSDLFMERVEANEDWSFSARMKHQAWPIATAKNLKNYTPNTKKKAVPVK
jgi:hypothetical protein